MRSALPWMGLGLSSNLDAKDRPHPYRLLGAAPGLFDYLEYSAPVSIEEARVEATLFDEMWSRREAVPVLFHPVHFNLYGPELEPAAQLALLSEHARAVGSPWVSNDVAWWHRDGEPFPGYLYLPPPMSWEGVADCARHVLQAKEGLVGVPLVLENPAIVALRGGLHPLDFMAALSEVTGCELLIDLGHLWSYQLSRGLPAQAGFDGFPWERVAELHLAGGLVTRTPGRTFYVDDHTLPVREELFELLEAVLPRCSGLRAVTFEGDGHPPSQAEKTLRRLRPLVDRWKPAGPDPEAEPPHGQAAPAASARVLDLPAPRLERAWEIYEATFRPSAASDPRLDLEGARVEEDFRLAVLAQALDRSWPLSRLLIAGDREGLAAFSRSVELETVFRDGGQVAQAFATFARRRLLGAPSEAAASVLAFELWAISLAARAPRLSPATPEPEAGRYRTAPGVAVGTFPVDLSELQFCAQSLRRHLGARAWATGQVDLSSLEVLAQAAGRAERRAWTVAVRRVRGRLEVAPLSPEVFALLHHLQKEGEVMALEDGSRAAWNEAARLGLVEQG